MSNLVCSKRHGGRHLRDDTKAPSHKTKRHTCHLIDLHLNTRMMGTTANRLPIGGPGRAMHVLNRSC